MDMKAKLIIGLGIIVLAIYKYKNLERQQVGHTLKINEPWPLYNGVHQIKIIFLHKDEKVTQ